MAYASGAEGRGIKVLIAGAGGAAHLAGVVAAKTILPVLGVPIESKALHGMDSLLSMVQMPGGIPVGTLAIGNAGATNAALLAAAILAANDPALYGNGCTPFRRAAGREKVLAVMATIVSICELGASLFDLQRSRATTCDFAHQRKDGTSVKYCQFGAEFFVSLQDFLTFFVIRDS